jgi:CDP-diacylglycerol--serine O-phosphatidyltransferase
MYCGLLCLVYTLNGDFTLAAWMIVLALLFDGSDGHIARLTKSTSNFGKELDSLADVVSFGVAPAVLVYRCILYDFERIGVFLVTVYAITGALRLARYNTQSGMGVKSFTGLPIPGAGCLIASFVLLKLKYNHEFIYKYLALLVILLAFLMVSTITYPKQELFRVPRKRAFQYIFILILLASFIMLRPTLFLFAFFLGYVTLGPINYLTKNRLFADSVPQEQEEAAII